MDKKSIFSEFVGLYPVQRTLRFELRPLETTKKYVDGFELDKVRDSYYPMLKRVLDDYYRYYIEETLSSPDFASGLNGAALYLLYAARGRDVQAEAEYRGEIKNAYRYISAKLNDRAEEFGLKKYTELIKNGDSKLVDFWVSKYKSGQLDEDVYTSGMNAIKCYVGYVTCLEGFKNNRDNIFAEGKPTSIADRIIQNMERHFENCATYKKLVSAYPQLADILGEAVGMFEPSAYFAHISQSGIDRYNAVIGHSADDINEQGVNQKINEFAQKNVTGAKRLPKMLVLYKQILSESGTVFFEEFKTDKDMLDAVASSAPVFIQNIKAIARTLSAIGEDPQGIYVTKKSLSGISLRLFDGVEEPWSVIDRALAEYKTRHGAASVAGDQISVFTLQKAIDEFCAEPENDMPAASVAGYLSQFSVGGIEDAYKAFVPLCKLERLSDDRTAAAGENEGGEGYRQIQLIKNLLDGIVAAHRFFRPFELVVKGKPVIPDDADMSIYNSFIYEYDSLSAAIPLYNKVRNYVTTVTKIDKSKLRNYLGCSSLLTGWSSIYENNGCYIVCDGGMYYLVEVLDKRAVDVAALERPDGRAWKVNYYLQKLDSKNFPRLFFVSRSFDQKYAYPDYKKAEKIYLEKTYLRSAPIPEEEYKVNIITMIDYYKYALSVHNSYKDLKFDFRPSSEYRDIAEFFNDASKCGYVVDKQPIDMEYLLGLEKAGAVLMFNIYNKDFSQYSHSTGTGTPNLHTLYFKMLFSDENLQNLRSGKPCFQLNGGAQIYTRYGSIERKITHPRNVPIKNKNPNNKKKQSVFDYDLSKDKRFSETKMFLHFPITINYRTDAFRGKSFNLRVNKLLYNDPSVNVIGIDRGERHLLYYTVIDRTGSILDQGSFNTISAVHDGTATQTNYRTLLDNREKQRDAARKNWGRIDQIAGLKEGYLSAVVHELCELMVKHNAVIVLENLEKGFKNSRIKVEKQVYQKFERSIIDKLNYLVFKKRGYTEDGGVLMGYQLTDKHGAYDDIGKQTGFMFYVDPAYTSKICPVTGFVNLFSKDEIGYTSVPKARQFFSGFNDIRYNAGLDLFEFSFNYERFSDYSALGRAEWKVCSNGERWYYSAADKEYKKVMLTAELKDLFDKHGVNYTADGLKDRIADKNDKAFFSSLMWLFRLTVQLRNTNGGTGDENDFILSPVPDKNGEFFDSRTAAADRPKNADANGAYHIALKGLWVLQHLSPDGVHTDCRREDWFRFRQ